MKVKVVCYKSSYDYMHVTIANEGTECGLTASWIGEGSYPISRVTEVELEELTEQEILLLRLNAIDVTIEKVTNEFTATMNQLKQNKQELLSLTYSGETNGD